MSEIETFIDYRNRLTLYAYLKNRVKDKQKLYEQLVVKPSRKPRLRIVK